MLGADIAYGGARRRGLAAGGGEGDGGIRRYLHRAMQFPVLTSRTLTPGESDRASEAEHVRLASVGAPFPARAEGQRRRHRKVPPALELQPRNSR